MSKGYSFTKNDVESAIESQDLAFSEDVKIRYRGEDGFGDIEKRWNGHNTPTYSASVEVSHEQDVVAAVKLARALNVGFLAIATRHGYGMSLGRLQGGLAIDLRRLNELEIDGDIITIGAYTTTEKIAEAVDKVGYQLPLASHNLISHVGVSIGGGLNRWSGLYGLTQDCMLSARVVLQDGQVVNVSESENSDLFWAVRGAGANFGIVVSATFRMQKAVNNGDLYHATIILSVDKAEAMLEAVKTAIEAQGPELSIMIIVSWHPGMNAPVLVLLWSWHGTEEAAQPALAPFLTLDAIKVEANMVRWTTLIIEGGEFVTSGWNRMVFGSNQRNIDVPTFCSVIDKLVKLWEDDPKSRKTALLTEFFSNRGTMKFKADATAYPWRDTTCNLFCCFAWTEPDPTMEDKVKVLGGQIRDEFTATNGYPGRSVYVNYAVGDETLEEIYGSALPRLLELKKRWDPENVFCYHHPLVRED
ncbi:FAD binding domain-containing protein [Sarocladium implicatum]|nr:FAD binding domain-containing protein [Sarocladium implicatum]